MDRERAGDMEADRQREERQGRGRDTGLLPGAWAVPRASHEGTLRRAGGRQGRRWAWGEVRLGQLAPGPGDWWKE